MPAACALHTVSISEGDLSLPVSIIIGIVVGIQFAANEAFIPFKLDFIRKFCVYFIFHFLTVAVVLFDDKCLSQNQHVNYHHIVVVEPQNIRMTRKHTRTHSMRCCGIDDRQGVKQMKKNIRKKKKQIGEFVIVQVGN